MEPRVGTREPQSHAPSEPGPPEPGPLVQENPEHEPTDEELQKLELQESGEDEGARWWCACGRSRALPHCDGSHRGSGITPVRAQPSEGVKLWSGAMALKECKSPGSRSR